MLERRLIAVEGVVQGVGFRPFVHRLATTLDLRGYVRNHPRGAIVDVEGEPEALESFVERLSHEAPRPATVDAVSVTKALAAGYDTFSIAASYTFGERGALVSPDVATCDECLRELFDRDNRRYRYPFITCAQCGPRFTITREVPFDRARTEMGVFSMCDACRREYEDPRNRRFHAETISCPQCAPLFWALDLRSGLGLGLGTIFKYDAGLDYAVRKLRDGDIVAVKGLGGFHLACDARNENTVRLLREGKGREAKPLAVMMQTLEDVVRRCEVSDAEAKLLTSAERPIVLLTAHDDHDIAPSVAPGQRTLGVMLPYTPLHHLLLADTGLPLVMTSANVSDEPILDNEGEVILSFSKVASCLLTHDRDFTTRCDDSVARVVCGAPVYVRRSRGAAPRPIHLALHHRLAQPTLALGGQLKNTFCLGAGQRAWLSHHIGDLGSADASLALEVAVEHYRELFGIEPTVVAHDLHPDYRSTRIAETIEGVTRVAVQHHVAHVASCVAEHGTSGPVLGVVFDGAGLGTDGAIWGGEFILLDGARWQRMAHLAYVPLPGGDAAAREPWRAAMAHLWEAIDEPLEELDVPALASIDGKRRSMLARMMRQNVNCPETSSVGRLFDAVAAIAGLCLESRFEGEAAMALEAIADRSVRARYHMDVVDCNGIWQICAEPLIEAVVADTRAGRPASHIAAAFHNGLRQMIVTVAKRIRRRTGVRTVALTGGGFQNVLLTELATAALTRNGFDVLLHREVPCNDGGLALGQLVLGAHAALEASCA